MPGPTTLTAPAQSALPASMQDTAWGDWTPGWAGAAATISDPGLDAVLSGLGFTLKGLASSTIDQIGSQIAQGVASGASMDSIAMGLRDSLGGDASRAYTIADTECARAAQDASMQTYQANGIEMLDWLVADDPCDDCQANADGGPYATADFPDLPAHPRCRCASSPNIESLTGGTSDDTTNDTDQGE
jgi:SPP1 gp7 family putative phage head morphogenesis protein